MKQIGVTDCPSQCCPDATLAENTHAGQTLTTMSTTQPHASPSPTAPSSPSSTSPATSPLGNTSTLLFGFLVSALSIFAIFMTSALVWNRLVSRRRSIDAMLAINPPRDPPRFHRPTIWDVWTMPDKQPPPWLDVKVSKSLGCNLTLQLIFLLTASGSSESRFTSDYTDSADRIVLETSSTEPTAA